MHSSSTTRSAPPRQIAARVYTVITRMSFGTTRSQSHRRETSLAPSRGAAPLVSIGIPVFNGARFLAEALDSALAQDYENFELVVCDNASTDETSIICERYASLDGRVRYSRNAENIGAARNFARVLEVARGTYFTWLAHDDALGNPGYLSALVEILERNPDVLLCASAVNVHDFAGPGTTTVARLDPLHPDQDWRQARREFFRCPYTSLVYFAVYGVARRDSMLRVRTRETRIGGRLVASDGEYAWLAELATLGRIVALPEALRDYRHRAFLDLQTEDDTLSPAETLRLWFTTKRRLLSIALRAQVPPAEKLDLVLIALGNFLSQNLSRPTTYKAQIQHLRAEVSSLQAVCAARVALIDELSAEAASRLTAMTEMDARIKELESTVAALSGQRPPHLPPSRLASRWKRASA